MICYDWVSLYIYQCVTLFTVVLHGGSWVPLECSCLSKCISVFIKKLLVHFYHSVSLRKNSLVRSSLPNNTNYDFLQLLTIPNSSNFNYRFIPENIMLIHTQTVGNSVAFLALIRVWSISCMLPDYCGDLTAVIIFRSDERQEVTVRKFIWIFIKMWIGSVN